ncbi:hypothetical protein [Streptomyces olivaceus]|uniref:hypothetical protein n=1 Tax=Streptomyces olivaceus TaxID=47716 RepID=UPI001CCEAAF2|nr:hypothetical protein [Streptomyces olivaceus]MBZ6307330.1 hypothetical protein [Streptomyces olivaceus]MBZ6321225.1 hypothetical protein [Streptomyces olivaceus]
MLNGIRRAVALARARHVPRGRHRHATIPTRSVSSTPPTPAVAPLPGRTPDIAGRLHQLPGEDNVLVRPYMLAGQSLVRRRSVVVAPRLSAETWSALTEVR